MKPLSRIIAAILVHRGNVVQTRQFKVTNMVGKAHEAVEEFHRWDADEIIVLNISRDPIEEFCKIINRLATFCFVPITAGGNVRSVEDARMLLRNGADKVTVNSAALERPVLIREIAQKFGSQAVVLSIDAQLVLDADPYLRRAGYFTADGRPALQWATQGVKHGAGEILLNCIDRDGDQRGYDLALLERMRTASKAPVIAFGGVSEWHHLADGLKYADAVAIGNRLHHSEQSVRDAKAYLRGQGFAVR